MLGMQTRESFLEWNEDYASDSLERRRRGNTTSRNPVIVNIEKSAPRLGNYEKSSLNVPKIASLGRSDDHWRSRHSVASGDDH